MPLARLDRSAIQGAITGWSRELAPGTVRVAYVYLAGICSLAVWERQIVATPCHVINLPRVKQPRVEPCSVELVQALTDAARERFHTMFVVGRRQGCAPARCAV